MSLSSDLPAILARLDDQPAAELATESLRFLAWSADPAQFRPALAETVVDVANHQGGTIICGIEPEIVGSAGVTGCGEVDFDELRRAVYAVTDPAILVSITGQLLNGRNLLVIDVPAGIPPHIVRTATRTEEDFTARLLDIGEEAIDPLEVERLRNILLAKQPSSELLRLANGELLRGLGILSEDEAPRLTVAGLLLVGRESALQAQLPGHEVIYLHMAQETEYDQRLDYRRPLLAVLDDLARQLELHNRLFTLKVGLFQFEIPDFPAEVYREALLNAFMHRDYARLSPVYIRAYADRVEIANPGGFPGGITALNIMSHEPVTRNRRLGEILQKLRLVERSGMGVRRMYTIQLSYGKEPPLYTATASDVRVTLRSGKADEPFARFIARRQQQGEEFTLNELIILAYLKRNQEVDLQEAVRLLQRGPHEAHEVLGAMVRRELLEPFGQKKGRVYRLSKAIYTDLRQSVEYHLHRDAEAAYAEAAITGFIRKNGSITNGIVRTLLRVNKSQSSYLLRRLVKSGRLCLAGHGKTARYELPPPTDDAA